MKLSTFVKQVRKQFLASTDEGKYLCIISNNTAHVLSCKHLAQQTHYYELGTDFKARVAKLIDDSYTASAFLNAKLERQATPSEVIEFQLSLLAQIKAAAVLEEKKEAYAKRRG